MLSDCLADGRFLYVARKSMMPMVEVRGKELPLDKLSMGNLLLFNHFVSTLYRMYIVSQRLHIPIEQVNRLHGVLLIDEIENHFNKEIVTTLVRFFMDSRLNKNGGTLIFTTHYPELLDEYDRNDGICIVRNRNGITAENLSYILKRNDIKKSDAYQSGFLEGTTPAYEAYMRLKKSLAASIN